MNWENIKSQLSDDKDKADLDEYIKNSDNLKSSLEKEELKSKEAIDGRQALKELVKTKLGLNEISETSLESVINQSGNTDEATKKLKNDYESILQENNKLKQDIGDIQQNHSLELKSKDLDNAYLNSGITSKLAKGLEKEQQEEVKKFILTGATIDDNGELLYKAENGTVQYNENNKPISMEDKINQYVSNPFNASRLSPDVLSGSSANPNNNGGGGNTVGKIDGTKAEQEAYIANKFKK